jgi:4-amino-4-deoxy-L-arabinose transferase-like glycosyltransferase
MSTTSPGISWPRQSGSERGLAVNLRRFKDSAPLAALLIFAGALYLWGLSRNGYANTYYAAAVQAGTHSWKAFLFGSLDAANYITVDKPPASLWLMEISSRVFGFSSFSMLLPQALEGIAAVALLYAAVKRWFGRRAALLSGLILAITPVAALMFRFNNPDALLVLLLVVAGYALTRALEVGSTRWLAIAGSALGFAFMTKELEAFLVLPAFALVYLVGAAGPLRRRTWQLVVAGGALLLSAGWWVGLVELWPASSRPYIGGSTDNSVLELIFGGNGLDRISSAGAGPGGGFSGSSGIFRLFNAELGGQISWLLPAALIALVAGAVWTVRRKRTDHHRTALLLWGGWLVVSGAIYSFMTGVIHPYYTNTLAPPIAVLVGVGATVLWRRRERLAARMVLAAMLAASAAWSYALLDRSSSWHPWLRFAILIGGAVAVVGICAGRRAKNSTRRAVATVGLLAALAGPAAYTFSAMTTAQAGGNPTAGPVVASARGFPGGGGPPPGGGGAAAPGPGGGATAPAPGSGATAPGPTRGATGSGAASGASAAGPAGGGASVSGALRSLLRQSSSRYTWVAATSSAQTAASLELSTGKPVMAIGGFNGRDPSITLARFEQLVAKGKIHYYVSGGGFGGGPGGAGGGGGGLPGAGPPAGGGLPPGALPGGGPPPGSLPGGGPPPGALPGGGSSSGGGVAGRGLPGGGRGSAVESQIQSWVASHYKSTTAGGTTVYDLTQPKAS